MLILKLHGKSEDSSGVFKVTEFPCTIGRSLRNQITIEDPTVSTFHGVIELESGHYVLRDLGSTNGIFFNGERRTEVVLDRNVKVKFGDVAIDVVMDEPMPDRTMDIQLPFKTRQPLSALIFSELAALTVAIVGAIWLGDLINYTDRTPRQVLLSGIAMLTLLHLASLVGAFFSKVHNGIYQYWLISRSVHFWALISIVLLQVSDLLIFNIHVEPLQAFGRIGIWFVILYSIVRSLFYRILLDVSRRRIRLFTASGVALLLLAVRLMAFTEPFDAIRVGFFGPIAYPLVPFSIPQEPLRGLATKLQKSAKRIEKWRKDYQESIKP